MTSHFVNYILLAAGIFTVLAAVIMIFLDKLKGDDIYFNLDVKEQEMKKVIEDAEELLSELNYTSDVIIKDIEEKINILNELHRNISSKVEQPMIQQPIVQQQKLHSIEKNTIPLKFKPITMSAAVKNEEKEENMNITKSKQQIILEMAEQGLSVIDIAKKLNMGQGEVSLILSLKNEES